MQKLLEPNKHFSTGIQLSVIVAIWVAASSSVSGWWWVISIVMFLLYTVIGNNVALHRYYSHNEFTVNRWAEWLFAWLSITLAMGSPLSYSYMHITHHRYPDYGPKWTLKNLLFCNHVFFDPATTPRVHSKRLVELDRKYHWAHAWNTPVILLYATVLLLVDWKVFLFVWWLPVTLAMWEITLAVYFQHKHEAINSPYHALFPTWEGLHKNHHDYPADSNNARESGQIDYTYHVTKLFAVKYRK